MLITAHYNAPSKPCRNMVADKAAGNFPLPHRQPQPSYLARSGCEMMAETEGHGQASEVRSLHIGWLVNLTESRQWK